MKKILTFFLFIILFSGFKFPEKNSNYVNDYAGLLRNSEINSLNKKLYSFENSNSVQLVIAIFETLENESLEDISMQIAEKWKIGQKKKDNGILITVFLKEHKIRIENGYGIENNLTDLKSAEIIRNLIAPQFKKGKFYDGLNNAVIAIASILGGDIYSYQQLIKKNKNANKPSFFSTLLSLIFIIIVFIIFAKNPWLFLFSGINISSGRGFGDSSSSSFGGGWSGGGGGSFGGGGASGGW